MKRPMSPARMEILSEDRLTPQTVDVDTDNGSIQEDVVGDADHKDNAIPSIRMVSLVSLTSTLFLKRAE